MQYTVEQVKQRIQVVNEVLNDMVDANMEFDQQETDNFDFDYFNYQLETLCAILEYGVGTEALLQFLQQIANASEEQSEELEWFNENADREYADQEAFANSL